MDEFSHVWVLISVAVLEARQEIEHTSGLDLLCLDKPLLCSVCPILVAARRKIVSHDEFGNSFASFSSSYTGVSL